MFRFKNIGLLGIGSFSLYGCCQSYQHLSTFINNDRNLNTMANYNLQKFAEYKLSYTNKIKDIPNLNDILNVKDNKDINNIKDIAEN